MLSANMLHTYSYLPRNPLILPSHCDIYPSTSAGHQSLSQEIYFLVFLG